MTVEAASKSVVRAYVDAFNRGDLDALKSLLADDAEIQGVMGKGTFERIVPVWRQLIEGYGMQLQILGLVAFEGTPCEPVAIVNTSPRAAHAYAAIRAHLQEPAGQGPTFSLS